MTKKTEQRLLFALRYILYHPDISPDIISKEWNISIDTAIDICSHNLAETLDYGLSEGGEGYERMEKKIYEKLMELK